MKKILATVLAFALCVSMAPSQHVHAEEMIDPETGFRYEEIVSGYDAAPDFEWEKEMKANEGKPEGKQFGMIAQYAGEVATNINKDSHYQAIKLDELAYMNLLTNQELIVRVEELERKLEGITNG